MRDQRRILRIHCYNYDYGSGGGGSSVLLSSANLGIKNAL
jgi:hypothetical protein